MKAELFKHLICPSCGNKTLWRTDINDVESGDLNICSMCGFLVWACIEDRKVTPETMDHIYRDEFAELNQMLLDTTKRQ